MSAILQIIRPSLRCVMQHDLPSHTFNMGLTGGIGSGKSTVARILQSYGVPVVDMDEISHRLTQAGGRALEPIAAHFGKQVIAEDGALNRAFVRNRVFSSPTERKILEEILHPMIAQDVLAQAHTLAQSYDFIAYDIPLLVESSTWQQRLDWIAVVECDPEEQILRVQARNPNLDRQTIKTIMATQASAEMRRAVANVVIDNHENISDRLNLIRQIDILVNYMSVMHMRKQYNYNLQRQT